MSVKCVLSVLGGARKYWAPRINGTPREGHPWRQGKPGSWTWSFCSLPLTCLSLGWCGSAGSCWTHGGVGDRFNGTQGDLSSGLQEPAFRVNRFKSVHFWLVGRQRAARPRRASWTERWRLLRSSSEYRETQTLPSFQLLFLVTSL